MSSVYTVLQAALLAGWRDSTVATAAGVAAPTWASTSAPHVFGGLGGSIEGRNLGRLPFVEVEVVSTDWDGEMTDGGTLDAVIACAVHVNGSDWQTASALAYDIATAALAAIRTNHLLRVGSVNITALEAGPWGHVLPVQLNLSLTYDEGDFTHG